MVELMQAWCIEMKVRIIWFGRAWGSTCDSETTWNYMKLRPFWTFQLSGGTSCPVCTAPSCLASFWCLFACSLWDIRQGANRREGPGQCCNSATINVDTPFLLLQLTFVPDQVSMALGINQMLQSMSYFIAGPVQKHRHGTAGRLNSWKFVSYVPCLDLCGTSQDCHKIATLKLSQCSAL
jgi:hypothetical protein